MGEVSVNPARIEAHGKEITDTVKPALEKARKGLNDNGTVEGGDFSVTGTLASMAYPMGLQFVYEDLNTHLEMLDGFAKNLGTAAKNYGGAETASTIKYV
ncbi:hypothetical protein E1293_20590 [Actinomadura darangshiensis]|uniref:WXG100 family type VII secretion target n=1 Tax=Actinomadura darangshiensis TaxID=705336 RepID=A0A4R5B667_9ACTN|nr:hypothetical protein [Actinomadura darangshiensis]TDD80513.1 hypothetical protein E1293_20590 [Actinomadura darangshiensis]